jgi:hypothetical protein
VHSIATTVSFSGQSGGTYYLSADITGNIVRSDTDLDALFIVAWSGSGFTSITTYAPVLDSSVDEDAARSSTALNHKYSSLDARLEAGETLAKSASSAAAAAQATANSAIAAVEQSSATRYRKVGLSLDNGLNPIETGPKGMVQVDFNGTIVGWSCIADSVGDLEVEVSIARTSPATAPPAPPLIPNVVTDKVSASAPISLSYSQSAAVAAAGVSTWFTWIQQWDVVQFSVVGSPTVKKATLYLRILES